MVSAERLPDSTDAVAANPEQAEQTATEYTAALHLHCYQPLRVLVLDTPSGSREVFNIEGLDRVEGGYNHWITGRSYRRLYEEGILANEHVSFDLYGVTTDWLREHEPDIVQGLQEQCRNGAPKPVGDPYLHLIFPFLTDVHKRTLIRLGKTVYREYWGADPEVFWLPESAVDTATVAALSAEGIPGLLLRDYQLMAETGASSYKVATPTGYVTVYPGDAELSQKIAFDHPWADAFTDQWAHRVSQRKHAIRVSVDGETLGHHWTADAGAIEFIRWQMEYLSKGHNGNTVIFQGEQAVPIAHIVDNTSWSCLDDGLGRWQGADTCSCDLPGDQEAAQAVRRSKRDLHTKMQLASGRIENLLDSHMPGVMDETGFPVARQAYIDWFMTQRYALAQGAPVTVDGLPEDQRQLFRLTLLRDVGWTSCGWYFGDVEGYERQIPANCLTAIAEETGWDDVRPA